MRTALQQGHGFSAPAQRPLIRAAVRGYRWTLRPFWRPPGRVCQPIAGGCRGPRHLVGARAWASVSGVWEDAAVNDLERAERAYQTAMFAGETDEAAEALRDLGGSGPEYDLARGKLRHCANIADRRLDAEELACFERAETAFAERGDLRGTGEALFWRGCYHQVLAGDDDTARPLFERALELSEQAGDLLMASYALRHLGISRYMAKDLDAAERLLQESTSLRRALGFEAGVAANLVGLAYIALDRGDRLQAQLTAQEAADAAQGCGAHAVAGWARQASEAAND